LTTALEPETPKSPNLPVRLRVVEDLERSRLTVFFRLLLTIPHFLWLGIWTLGVLIVVFFGWFVVLIRGQMPDGMHRFFTMYIRYATHVNAYLNLAANPFPGFLGENGYEVDLEFDPPARQNRWKTGFRFFLLIPAALVWCVDLRRAAWRRHQRVRVPHMVLRARDGARKRRARSPAVVRPALRRTGGGLRAAAHRSLSDFRS
jgi:hypothetical protein